jgi:tetratricopeptide (TPR) repeat protein
MKAKFAKSKNSRDALLLAKAYYKEGKYQESEQWALSANKLDNNLEESWLLFAKAKAKLGKKEEAVTILASYYKKSHSTKAKSLMGQIKTGKI